MLVAVHPVNSNCQNHRWMGQNMMYVAAAKYLPVSELSSHQRDNCSYCKSDTQCSGNGGAPSAGAHGAEPTSMVLVLEPVSADRISAHRLA